ncbi:MAG: putative zinc-binding protein [Candidatus Bathyarchaeia archaeon]
MAEGRKTHENVIYACFGCFSNTGVTAGLASLEAVKELGLEKAAVGCLASLPLGIAPVITKTKAARKIITVDGCPFECSRRTVEAAGFRPAKSFMLVRDIGMKKKSLHEDIGGDVKPLMDYISREDVEKAKSLIIEAVQDGAP